MGPDLIGQSQSINFQPCQDALPSKSNRRSKPIWDIAGQVGRGILLWIVSVRILFYTVPPVAVADNREEVVKKDTPRCDTMLLYMRRTWQPWHCQPA